MYNWIYSTQTCWHSHVRPHVDIPCTYGCTRTPLLFSLWPKSAHERPVLHKQTGPQSERPLVYTLTHTAIRFPKLPFKMRTLPHSPANMLFFGDPQNVRITITSMHTNGDKHAGLFHHSDGNWDSVARRLLSSKQTSTSRAAALSPSNLK